MRSSDLLESSNPTYMAMLNGLLSRLKGPMRSIWANKWREWIDTARETCGPRKDRMVWFLRWDRLGFIRHEVSQRNLDIMGITEADVAELSKEYSDALGYDINTAWSIYSNGIGGTLQVWKHFCHHPSPQIQAIIWDRQSPMELKRQLREAEKEWTAQTKDTIMHDGGEKPFLRVDGEWAWYDLEKSECSKEAAAMGHCGNADGQWSDTILSLRRHVKGNLYRPSLTFICSSSGILGEMKGRENNKPHAKYHDAIVKLLLHPRIVGIMGGGYEPENNFELADLVDSYVEKLLVKPELFKNSKHEVIQLWDARHSEITKKAVELMGDGFSFDETRDVFEIKRMTFKEWRNTYPNCRTNRLLHFYSTNGFPLDERFYTLVRMIIPWDVQYRSPSQRTRMDSSDEVVVTVGLGSFVDFDKKDGIMDGEVGEHYSLAIQASILRSKDGPIELEKIGLSPSIFRGLMKALYERPAAEITARYFRDNFY